MSDDVAALLAEASDVHEQKNADYNDCWREVGYTMYRMAGEQPLTLDSPQDYASLGLYWERLIKLYRAFNGEFLSDELNHESIEDSHTDNINYSAMHAALQDDR